MKKLIGYFLSAIGLFGIVIYSVPEIAKISKLPEALSGTSLAIFSGALVIVGLFIVIKSGGSSKQNKEVPIFKGKNIVGYRQH